MKKIIIMSLLGTIFGFFCCNAQSEKSDSAFKSVEVQEFAEVIADSALILLDTRTAEEYAEGHIDNAINIDVLRDDFESKATSTLPKDKTIALYCRSGRRSKNAAKILTKNGYTVVELNSGYNGWKKSPSPLPLP